MKLKPEDYNQCCACRGDIDFKKDNFCRHCGSGNVPRYPIYLARDISDMLIKIGVTGLALEAAHSHEMIDREHLSAVFEAMHANIHREVEFGERNELAPEFFQELSGDPEDVQLCRQWCGILQILYCSEDCD